MINRAKILKDWIAYTDVKPQDLKMITVVEEIANQCLALEQMCILYNIDRKEIEDEMNYKCLMIKHLMEKKNESIDSD